ncbi:MAG: methylated-DNA--[protein]-cysteine S-methyltransferase [Thermodesulfobacteriota bacterium]
MERTQSIRRNDRADQPRCCLVIALKPGIRVQVHATGSLQRISLFLSPSFIFDTEHCHPSLIEPLASWLKAYSQRKFLPFPLPFPAPSFRADVLRFLHASPWGSIFSYQDVAKAVGSPRAARAVGNICQGNPFPLLVPCHRVIRADGSLGRYTPNPTIKMELLQFEDAI